MFLDFSRVQLQLNQAPNQKTNPKHKQEIPAKNIVLQAYSPAKPVLHNT